MRYLSIGLMLLVWASSAYALGAGKSPQVMLNFEYGRYRQMRDSDFRDGIRIGDVVLPLRLSRESIRQVQHEESIATA